MCGPSSRTQPWVSWVGVLAAGAAFAVAYAAVPRGAWVNWDDPVHVLDNPLLRGGCFPVAPAAWQGGYRGLYIPISYCLFGAEAAASRWLAGAAADAPPPPLAFHVVSLALHAACVALVWRLLVRMCGDGRAAVVGATLFAVHPQQAESVAWISEQRGLLAAALSLIAVNCWTDLWLWGRRPTPWQAVCGTAAFSAALLAKPSAMIVPLLVAVLAVLHGRAPLRRILVPLAPWFGLACGCGLITRLVQPVMAGVAPAPALRPLVALDALAFYATKLAVPLGLCIDYGRTPAAVLADPLVGVRAAVSAVAIVAVFVVPACRPARLPLALWLVPLAPVLGLVPFAFQAISTVADRYAYLAMLGPAAGLTTLLAGRPNRAAFAVCWTALAVAAFMTARQSATWRDSLTLNERAFAINGGTRDTCNNLGLALLESGRHRESIDRFRRAIDCDPNFTRARFNLGLAHHELGETPDAERCYEAALAADPSYAAAHNNLGILLASQGRFAAARDHFQAAAHGKGSDAAANLERLERLMRAAPAPPR